MSEAEAATTDIAALLKRVDQTIENQVSDTALIIQVPRRGAQLFITQGCQGIEFGGAIGRQKTGERSDGGEGNDRHYESERVARL